MLNVVGTMRELLEQALELPVYVNVPATRPARFIVINRGGGAWVNRVLDRAGINVYTYGESEADAYELMERTCEVIRALPFKQGFSLMEMENMRSDYDLTTKVHRWYSSWTITNYQPKE